jgi:hypothetical protein
MLIVPGLGGAQQICDSLGPLRLFEAVAGSF